MENIKLKILITTCREYFDKIGSELIKCIDNSDIIKENIIIISGGGEDEKVYYINNIKIVEVKYRCFEFTSFIYAVENNLDCDYIFMSHDNVIFKKNFYSKMYKKCLECKKNNFETMKLKSYSLSMNIGLYSYDYLIKNKKTIIKLKKYNNNYDELLKIKHELCALEDIFFKKSNNVKFGLINNPENEKIDTLIQNDKSIRELTYSTIDYIKYQQNYNNGNSDMIISL